jgi:methyl-accepting chemotaxis protein
LRASSERGSGAHVGVPGVDDGGGAQCLGLGAGKGFAVVASEVKSVAKQTARATKEITGQIGQIQTATKAGVDAIRVIAEMIEGLGSVLVGIADSVEPEGTATADCPQRAADRAIDARGDGKYQQCEQCGDGDRAAADQVKNATVDLSGHASQLTGQVGTFVRKVRAA